MFSRRLPSLVLVAALALLLAGGGALERVFVQERRDAIDAIEDREAALREYALRDLQERCRDRLAAERVRLDAALDDPLVDGSNLLHVRSGRQLLPRQFTFLAEEASSGVDLYHQLMSGALAPSGQDEDDPWVSRVQSLELLRDALESRDRAAIERAFRGILSHRARFVIESRKDLFYQVALLDLLEEKSEPDPELMRMMLRDGVTSSNGITLPGLQRMLLDRREKLTQRDFEFLTDRVTRLSEASGVPYDDFRARAAEESAPTVLLPEVVRGLTLVGSGQWLIEPSEEGAIIEGVVIDLPSLLELTRTGMRQRGLIEEDDALILDEAVDPLALEALQLAVDSPRSQSARAAIERRFWLKTGLAVALLALTGGAILSWSAWTKRERQVLALKSDFVATVSHELRTPLASMRLMAETLERRLSGVDSARDYPRRLVREIDSLTFLIDNILSFSRLSKGRWEPRIEDVRLSEIVRTLRQELPGTTRARVDVQFEDDGDRTLRADPELMRLLFLNLGTNACKYNNGDLVEIRIEAEAPGPLLVRVADNGIGIPEDQAEKVFSEFYRAEPGGRGFGLGLAICRRIMELHEGSIRVADSSAEGTVFEMSFP